MGPNRFPFALVVEFEPIVGCRVNNMKMYRTPLSSGKVE
jgi:hypothetical protein